MLKMEQFSKGGLSLGAMFPFIIKNFNHGGERTWQ